MDHRDAVSFFGVFQPSGARFDARSMTLAFSVEREVVVSEALVAAATTAFRRVQAAYEAEWAMRAAQHEDGCCGWGQEVAPETARVAALRAEVRAANLAHEEARRAYSAAQDAAYRTEMVEYRLPCRMEVCGACGGRGSYVNPAIDAHGIGADEWADWDEDDRQGYLDGRYDVACEECRGQRVVPVPEEPSGCSSASHKAAWAAYCEWSDDEGNYRAERAAEIRMGY